MPTTPQQLIPAVKTNPADKVAARFPFFYGWVMLPIAIAGLVATSPGQTYCISVFNAAFKESLSLSNTQLTAAYMIGTLCASLPMTYVGALMDMYGIRRVMFIVVILLGCTCLATSRVTNLETLFIAFLFLRMLGQGALTMLSSNTVAMWFHDRLGTASGLMNIGNAAAIAIIPPMNIYFIEQIGWRLTYVCLGLGVWVLMLPLLGIFYRNTPEEIGQIPDGRIQHLDDEHSVVPQDLVWSMTLRQAWQTRSYWIVLAMNCTWALVGTGLIFYIVQIYEQQALSKYDASLFYTLFAVSMAATQLTGGYLADRCRLNLLLFGSMFCMGLAIAFLTVIASPTSSIIFAISLGASQGLFIVLSQTIWPRYFGRTHLGKIRGTVGTASVAGSSIGPFIMGLSQDHFGTFTPAIWLFAITYVVLSITALWATPPDRQLQA